MAYIVSLFSANTSCFWEMSFPAPHPPLQIHQSLTLQMRRRRYMRSLWRWLGQKNKTCTRGSLPAVNLDKLNRHRRALPAPQSEMVLEVVLLVAASGGRLTRGRDTKSCLDSVVQLSNILAHTSPSLNHGEAANCQLLCPHYPRPPAQTGALGHCPRNHSAPVAHKET